MITTLESNALKVPNRAQTTHQDLKLSALKNHKYLQTALFWTSGSLWKELSKTGLIKVTPSPRKASQVGKDTTRK